MTSTVTSFPRFHSTIAQLSKCLDSEDSEVDDEDVDDEGLSDEEGDPEDFDDEDEELEGEDEEDGEDEEAGEDAGEDENGLAYLDSSQAVQASICANVGF